MAYDVEAYSEVVDGVVVQVEQGVELGNLGENRQIRELATAVRQWVDNLRPPNTRRGSLLERQVFNPPANVYSEMRAAREAVRSDDVVAGVAEITEAFAFQGGKAESEHEDTNDIFNQINRDLDMDAVFPRMWREAYAQNQFVMAVRWERKDYTLRAKPTQDDSGRTSRPKRRSSKFGNLLVPTKIALLDSTCVLPIQSGPLGEETLLWSASQAEIEQFDKVEVDNTLDPEMNDFFIGRYRPSGEEVARFAEMGFGSTDRLLIMNPRYVRRYTTTRPDYELFADVRLKSAFAILDMKRQLMDQDRVNLVGAANFILLIRKGLPNEPATPDEMQNLRDNYQVLAKLPVIIADHRLTIEIIAPPLEHVLDGQKYDVLDSRLLSRLLGTLSIGGKGQRNETNVTMSYAVARGMEHRRKSLARFVEREIYRQIVERNPDAFPVEPSYAFTPARIALGFDAALAQMMISLHASRDLSRETILEFVGQDQATEALRKEIEARIYDGKVFDNVLQPGQVDPKTGEVVGTAQQNGGQGGRPAGKTAQNKTGDVTPKTESGSPSTKRSGS